MSICRFLCLSSLGFSLFTLPAEKTFSKQGYHTYFEALPARVQKWVPRTYMVYNELHQVPAGSAFLIHNDGQEAHFLTANHVAAHCLGKGTCSLRWGAGWIQNQIPNSSFSSPVNLEIKDVLIFDPQTPDWKGASVAADLAYIKARSNSSVSEAAVDDLGMSFLNEIQIQTVFQRKHFALGYPGLMSRPSYRVRPENAEIRLRWSEGEKIRPLKVMKKYRVGTDADTLPGNSGGPMVFEDGRLLGILVGGPMSYEYIAYPVLYSYVVPIDTAKRLIGDILLGKSNHISLCKTPFGQNQQTCQEAPFESAF